MSSSESCPHCGLPLPPSGDGVLDALGHELGRLSDIAAGDVEATQRRAEDQRRIAELTREVRHLRATVARLRGTGIPAVVSAVPLRDTRTRGVG